MHKKNILYLIGSAGVGGAETFMRHTARYHDRTKFEPIYVCLRRGPLVATLESCGVKVYVPDFVPRLSRPVSYLRCLRWLKQIIHSEKIDLVHSTMAYGALYGGVAAAMARVQHVWFQHGPVGGWMNILAGLMPSKMIFVNSDFTFQYQSKIQLRSIPVEKVHLGADPVEIDKRVMCETVPHPLRVLFVSRLERGKGVDIFLKGLVLANQTLGGEVCVEASVCADLDGQSGDHLLRHELNDFIQKNHLKIKRVPSTENVHSLYAVHDVIVNASTFPETFGLTIVEGMMSGLVPVVARHGGAAEIFTHGSDGLFFEKSDWNQLGRHLVQLSQDRSFFHCLQQKAVETANRMWRSDRTVKEIEMAYWSVLK